MTKKIKYLLSFILPISIFFIISWICGFIPFGAYSHNIFDAFFEYPTFIMELRNMLRGAQNIFYTMHGALGVNFFSILTLYGGSPLNLLFYFFPQDKIYLFYTLLIYFKIGASGFTMYVYLNSLSTKYKDTFWNIVFALIYALSGYVVAFNMHVMWMDAYLLLPIIIKYLDRLIIHEEGTIYAFMLAAAIIINYYTGFMLCIFMVIYFIYKSLIVKKFTKNVIRKFLFYSVMAGLISTVVLIPNLINLLQGRFSNLTKPNLFSGDFYTIFSLIYNMSIGSFVIGDNYNFGSTTIYTTLFSLVLVIYLFFNKKISKREKIITGSVIAFFNISFSFNLLDLAWNMFQNPIWWSHRYQFVYIFLFIVIAYGSFVRLDGVNIESKIKNIIIIVFSIFTLLSFSYKVKGLGLSNFYIFTLFVSLVLFIIYMHKINNKKMWIIFILLEIGLNSYMPLTIHKKFKYEEITQSYRDTKKVIEQIEDRDNYRIVKWDSYSDEGLLLGFNSVELFSSSYNMQNALFMDKVKIERLSLNNQSINNANPPMLSLLGVKYMIGESDYYSCNDGVCENKYAMPFMYQVSKNVLSTQLNSSDYKENINSIYSSLLNREVDLFVKLNLEDIAYNDMEVNEDVVENYGEDAKFTLMYRCLDEALLVYNTLYYEGLKPEIYINGEKLEKELEYDNLIRLKPQDKLEFVFFYNKEVNYKNISKSFYILNIKKYEEAIKELNKNVNYINLESDKSILKGRIKTEDGIVLITLPYDKGIKIKVDGKNTNYFTIFDNFLGINVSQGEHIIEINYFPRGLKIGLIISILSLIGLCLVALIHKKRKKS